MEFAPDSHSPNVFLETYVSSYLCSFSVSKWILKTWDTKLKHLVVQQMLKSTHLEKLTNNNESKKRKEHILSSWFFCFIKWANVVLIVYLQEFLEDFYLKVLNKLYYFLMCVCLSFFSYFQSYRQLTGSSWSLIYFVSFYLISVLLLLNLVRFE